MVALARSTALHSLSEESSAFAADVLAGLTAERKTLPPKYFYDDAGSQLFEQITAVPEYYPTRTEMKILEENGAAIAASVSEKAALIEFGSGSARKVRVLLRHLPKIAAYVPVDICPEMLVQEARALRQDFPHLRIEPVAADFCQPFDLPLCARNAPARVGFFPGSTIGNFEPHEAASFMRNAASILGAGATLIVGVDLVKPVEILNAAYNDKQGVTAKFNRNILVRINRELGANFKPEMFEHHAFFNRERSRIEMHLASKAKQKVRVLGETVEFRTGETIHTENSYKYTPASLSALARGAGWAPRAAWTDADGYFSIQAFMLSEDGAKAARIPG